MVSRRMLLCFCALMNMKCDDLQSTAHHSTAEDVASTTLLPPTHLARFTYRRMTLMDSTIDKKRKAKAMPEDVASMYSMTSLQQPLGRFPAHIAVVREHSSD